MPRQLRAAPAPLCADGIPILIGLVNHRAIAKGPFNLGPIMSPVMATIACLWICFITVRALPRVSLILPQKKRMIATRFCLQHSQAACHEFDSASCPVRMSHTGGLQRRPLGICLLDT